MKSEKNSASKAPESGSQAALREMALRVATKAGERVEATLDSYNGEPPVKDLLASVGVWLDKASKLLDSAPPPARKEEEPNLPTLAAARKAVEAAKGG